LVRALHPHKLPTPAPHCRTARELAWQDLRALIEDSKYVELSNNLLLPPMDDLRQAVLYLPAALLKVWQPHSSRYGTPQGMEP